MNKMNQLAKLRKENQPTLISLGVVDHKVKIGTTTQILGFEYFLFQIRNRYEIHIDRDGKVIFYAFKFVIHCHSFSSRETTQVNSKQSLKRKNTIKVTSAFLNAAIKPIASILQKQKFRKPSESKSPLSQLQIKIL